MPSPFLNSLIAVSANLVLMILIYSLLANALVRLHWRGHGPLAVIALIFVAGLFWIAPLGALGLAGFWPPPGSAFWVANWLVLGCSVVILCQRVPRIPRELEDSARLDGVGWFGIYRRIVLPLVRRELTLIALLTVMATSLFFWLAFSAPDFSQTRDFPPWFYLLLQIAGSDGHRLAGMWLAMVTGSLVMTLPVILIFFLAKRYLEEPSNRLEEAKPTSSAAE